MTCDMTCAAILAGASVVSIVSGVLIERHFDKKKARIDAETAAVSEARKALDRRIDERAAKFQREVR